MASTGTWETVRGSKKSKNTVQNGSKSQKKILAENMPRIDSLPPVKESQTIYDAFLEKDKPATKKTAEKQEKDQAKVANENINKKPSSTKKKQTEKPKKDSSLKAALVKIDAAELESLLLNDQSTFPDNPSVWLKDIVSFVNIKLDCVQEQDPVFDGKPNDYPLNQVPDKIRAVMKSALGLATPQVQEIFFEHCVQSMITDMGKGVSTYGYRIFIQLLIHSKPELNTKHYDRYLELIKSNQNRHLRCLSVMWALGQAGVRDLGAGLRVWIDVMIPVLGIRALSGYAVTYLDNLFRWHQSSKQMKKAYYTIGFRDYFPILDIVMASASPLPSKQQKVLLDSYPKVKEIAFGDKQETSLRNFFPSFLARVVPSCSPALRDELMLCLVTSLSKDKHCFSVWRQMYTKHVPQSSALLKYILDEWDSVSAKLDKSQLKETLRAFNVTNEELAASAKNSSEYKECQNICQELLQKMTAWKMPWSLVVLFIFALVAGLLFYDIHSNGGFEKSKSALFLKETGLLVFILQLWSNLQFYFNKAYSWVATNAPVYYNETAKVVGPYCQLVLEKSRECFAYLMEISQPFRARVYDKCMELWSVVEQHAPYYLEMMSTYLVIGWSYVLHYTMIAIDAIVFYAHMVWDWLLKNVFVGSFSIENIQKVLTNILLNIQDQLGTFALWCRGYHPTSTS